ncbi:uncharacterized protein LY89DRAFT_778640, partial [Mollisia scopiformis]
RGRLRCSCLLALALSTSSFPLLAVLTSTIQQTTSSQKPIRCPSNDPAPLSPLPEKSSSLPVSPLLIHDRAEGSANSNITCSTPSFKFFLRIQFPIPLLHSLPPSLYLSIFIISLDRGA